MTSRTAIADLHCDLLEHLTREPGRSPFDRSARCSLPQLREGNVAFQVLAIFGLPGTGSSEIGLRQAKLFGTLAHDHPESLIQVRRASDLSLANDRRTRVMAAVEGGSAFCDEDEPLDEGFARLLEIERETAGLLYVSLTWHTENRFGGGNGSEAGLKADGAHLLELLADRGIAVDLSHTSPRLAREILEHIDSKGLSLPVLASHSNFTAVVDIPRNLPDDVAREIIARDGVIGLNFVRRFLGDSAEEGIVANVEHALSLGAAETLGLGADFFCDGGLPTTGLSGSVFQHHGSGYFFEELGEPAAYPFVLRQLEKRGLGTDGFADALAHANVLRFVRRILGD